MAKVLIVIQDAALANFIGLVLHRHGYQVSVAGDITIAHEQFALTCPDLLIATKQELENDPGTRFATQATSNYPLLLICDSPGCTAEALFRPDWLPYPFGVKELVKRVEEIQRTVRMTIQ